MQINYFHRTGIDKVIFFTGVTAVSVTFIGGLLMAFLWSEINEGFVNPLRFGFVGAMSISLLLLWVGYQKCCRSFKLEPGVLIAKKGLFSKVEKIPITSSALVMLQREGPIADEYEGPINGSNYRYRLILKTDRAEIILMEKLNIPKEIRELGREVANFYHCTIQLIEADFQD